MPDPNIGSGSAAQSKDIGSGSETRVKAIRSGSIVKSKDIGFSSTADPRILCLTPGPNENTPKYLQNHENTSKALIFILRNKSINA
jgi:hypothetical protein